MILGKSAQELRAEGSDLHNTRALDKGYKVNTSSSSYNSFFIHLQEHFAEGAANTGALFVLKERAGQQIHDTGSNNTTE